MGEPGRYINRFDATAAPVVWARPGERLIVPVRPTDEQIAAGEMVARLDRGRAIPAPLYLLWPDAGSEPGPGTASSGAPGTAGSERWLEGFPGVAANINATWRTAPADRAPPLLNPPGQPGVESSARTQGVWIAVLEMPEDGAGQGLWLASRRVPIGWLMAPPYRPSGAEPAGLAPRESHARLIETLTPALRSPFLRWRARLTLRAAGYEGWRTAGAMTDAVTERLAQQIEDEWSFGLDALAATDPATERRLRDHLAGLVVLASSPEEPAARATVAWAPDLAAIERIKSVLLRAGDPPDARIGRVHDWLRGEPSVGAWVIDDAGLFDGGTLRPMATIGLVRLGGVEGELVAFGTSEADGRAQSVLRVEPSASASLTIGVPPIEPDRAGATPGRSAQIGIGAWRTERRLLDRAAEVRPPGLPIEPLLEDWTMTSWWANAMSDPEGPLPPPAAVPFAAVLTRTAARHARTAPAGFGPNASGMPDEWTLYMEAASPSSPTGPDAGPFDAGPDEVRLWIGPRFSPLAVCTVRSDGSFETAGPVGRTIRADVLRWNAGDHERWGAWVRLSVACFEHADPVRGGGPRTTLRLGIERTDPLGRRSAWPRPMTPWQTEPGRLRIDVAAWGGLDRPGRLTPP